MRGLGYVVPPLGGLGAGEGELGVLNSLSPVTRLPSHDARSHLARRELTLWRELPLVV